MKEINVFYHVFTVNHWRHVLDSHIEQLRHSGLYDACSHIHVGAVYTEHRDLSELDSATPRQRQDVRVVHEEAQRRTDHLGAAPRCAATTDASANVRRSST